MEGILKGQKIPTFEGKKEEFGQWAYIFLSICHIAGCKRVLIDDTYNVPSESTDLSDKNKAGVLELLEKQKSNGTAYALLAISVKDTTGFQAIRNAVSNDLPNGCARTAWKNLLRIFQPKTKTHKFELEQAFNDCKYQKETRNPDDWFTELEQFRVLLKEDHAFVIDDDRMIQHIVYNIKPKSFHNLITMLKRDLEYKTVILDLNQVKDEIRQVWGQINEGKPPETALTAGTKRKASETALAAKFKKKLKGECRVCGAKGHKATDCWDNERNKSKRPTWYKNPNERKKETANITASEKPKLYCTYCKKDNHTEDRCFKKQKDAANLPPITKSTANVILLCYDACLLSTQNRNKVNPNTFVADSGASGHMVHSRHLLTDFKSKIDWVMIGDNTAIKSLGTGTFKGNHTNQNGQHIDVTLTDLLLVPDLWVNIFSITKATSNTGN
jgi:hypothetical protein